MAESLKSLQSNDWNLVTRRKQKPKIVIDQHPKASPWVPSDDSEIDDPKKQCGLMQRMTIAINTLEKSDFYCNFLQQIETDSQFSYYLSSVLGSEVKMQMVIYGIGNIDESLPSRMQLALAILMKRKFDWIGQVEVFDPVLKKTEVKVLELLGCSVLYVNENGRRRVSKPTIFFMPHCDIWLYDHLLEANWNITSLKQMVVLGNSFSHYAESRGLSNPPTQLLNSIKHVLDSKRLSVEIGIRRGLEDYVSFRCLSWHFFKT